MIEKSMRTGVVGGGSFYNSPNRTSLNVSENGA